MHYCVELVGWLGFFYYLGNFLKREQYAFGYYLIGYYWIWTVLDTI